MRTRDAQEAGLAQLTFTADQTGIFDPPPCPGCGQSEWWTFYRDPRDGLWRLSVGHCSTCP
ncbi:hypothetical protein [Kineococcus sp. SYSU DK006]|uniref:hypothetical protein n=1 Tax=Kineococcus sp. SYSU DK006 TaxID=3383127 RepID=UPI003D7DB503